MSHTVTPFPGTAVEAFAFLQAVADNCTCRRTVFGSLIEACGMHHAIPTDTLWLTHSVYARRLAPRLLAEEFGR